jgi:hypothetical protein
MQDPEYGQSTLQRTVRNYSPVKMALTFPENVKSPLSQLWIISANGVLSWYPTMEAAWKRPYPVMVVQIHSISSTDKTTG